MYIYFLEILKVSVNDYCDDGEAEMVKLAASLISFET